MIGVKLKQIHFLKLSDCDFCDIYTWGMNSDARYVKPTEGSLKGENATITTPPPHTHPTEFGISARKFISALNLHVRAQRFWTNAP